MDGEYKCIYLFLNVAADVRCLTVDLNKPESIMPFLKVLEIFLGVKHYFWDVIHLSKVYNSVAFSVFAELCNDRRYWIPEHFLSSLRETLSG